MDGGGTTGSEGGEGEGRAKGDAKCGWKLGGGVPFTEQRIQEEWPRARGRIASDTRVCGPVDRTRPNTRPEEHD